MKKKIRMILLAVILLAILFVPIPTGVYKDGGTRVYSALTYKIVNWNRLTGDSTYQKTRVYFLADRFRSIDALWDREQENVIHKLTATVIEQTDSTVLVAPLKTQDQQLSCERISFSTEKLEKIHAPAGSLVEISYLGQIWETDPATIDATSWKLYSDTRHIPYSGQWLAKTADNRSDLPIADITITKIYADCFFARTVIASPYEIKLNGELSEYWCPGDQVRVSYENLYHDQSTHHVEADLITVETSYFTPEPGVAYKPVIYLYPERQTDVTVNLTLDGELTSTYPAYKEGWKVSALPDGTLFDEKGLAYNYLYWEGKTNAQYDFSKGFCVKGQDTAAFLEDALAKLGLTRREANEFIVYWLPLMEQNPYNIISFQDTPYTDAAKLQVQPAPDTLIRVFMAWKPANEFAALAPQTLTAPERTGFTVIEWGGARVPGNAMG